MLLHLHIPGFHATVHQAVSAALRERPVAVAVDAHPQAPLFDTCPLARAAGIWPGLSAQAGRRRCPGLRVVTPDPGLYRRAQRAVLDQAVRATPRVGGRAGGIDLDLAGTEQLWRHAGAEAPAQAAWWAGTLHHRLGDLRLPAAVGIAGRLRIARLAANAASVAGADLHAVPPGAEAAAIAPWPLRWLRDLPEAAHDALRSCGVRHFGAVAALPADDLRQLLGAHAETLLGVFSGEDEPEVPACSDPSPSLAVSRACGPGGADAAGCRLLVAGLARDLGFELRRQGLACGGLTFEGRHLDGRTVSRSARAPQGWRHDDELETVVLAQAAALERRVAWERLALTATGLVTGERQQCFLAPPRQRRMEAARDHLRARFGEGLLRNAVDLVAGHG